MDTDQRPAGVVNNEGKSRFELSEDGHLATITYKRQGERIIYIHTQVPQELGGRGIANKLASSALDFAREGHLRVIPKCPFVVAYIKRHSEYLELVDSAFRRDFMAE